MVLERHFLWQAQQVMLECHFSWQAQQVILERHFSWHAQQHVVKFWEIAGARDVVFVIQNARGKREKYPRRTGGCEMTSAWSDHGWIMVGTVSGRPRIGLTFRVLFVVPSGFIL